MPQFDDVIEGIVHWQAPHPRIGLVVHSYYLSAPRVAIDPIGSDGLVDALAERGGVERVLLTNRHHLRGSEQLVDAFGCDVLAPEPGMHEFDRGQPVGPYEWDEEVAPGVVSRAVGAICPDDGALEIRIGAGALALADGVIGWEGQLAFVPDFLMDEPELVKPAQIAALNNLMELEFDTLLLAHGEPIASGAKEALKQFLAAPVQAEWGGGA